MSFLTRTQRDELRTTVLGELVVARSVALSAEMLARRVARSRVLAFDFDLAAVEAEIAALHSGGFAAAITGTVATTPHYQATAAGVLAHERGA